MVDWTGDVFDELASIWEIFSRCLLLGVASPAVGLDLINDLSKDGGSQAGGSCC